VGNVVGSNLANLTLVLGVAGLIAAPEAVPRILRREAPLSFAAVALFALVVQGGMSRAEGGVLLIAFAVATAVMLRVTEPAAIVEVEGEPGAAVLVEEVEELVEEEGETTLPAVQTASTRRDVARAAVALAATVVGAQLLVAGARSIASAVGLSGGFVGLTIVALGTSLPELVTAAHSARRGETALLVGTVLGSNVFNSTAVAASAALIGPRSLDEPHLTVLAVSSMVFTAALAWLFLGLGGRLRRWKAAALLVVYAATLPFTR
jgi:cation:H+ antiporter